MAEFLKYLALLMALVVCYQFYAFAVSRIGKEKQEHCQKLGIVFMSIGIVSLIFRTGPAVIGGLVLIMLGFRLIAQGLDRINKKTFIDRYDEDQ
ncbi:MAG: hypothetical protein CXR31_00570 [Geobacter sp.]|nr:MAG: hypothetical protein CXR31_00570 [Geobacter sp.]